MTEQKNKMQGKDEDLSDKILAADQDMHSAMSEIENMLARSGTEYLCGSKPSIADV